MIKKLLFVIMFLTFSLQIKAEINQSTIFVLGSLDKETKQLFKETIYDQIHNYAQTISLETQSNIYVFPYQNQNQWQVVSLHVQGNENHSYLLDLSLELSLIHISEPTRHLRISYAVFCLKKKN